MREHVPGGWWRDTPLPVSTPRPEAIAAREARERHARWAAFVTAERDKALEQWQAGDRSAALRTMCGAGIFGLSGTVGGWQAVKRVRWNRSGAVSRIEATCPRLSVMAGGVRAQWHEATVLDELLHGEDDL